jgi:hypothetical protein
MDTEKFEAPYGSKVTVFDGKLISGERSYYSDPFPAGGQGNFGIWYKATSVLGVPNLRLWYEMSCDETLINFAVPEGVDNIVNNWSGEMVVVDKIRPPLMPWIRMGVQGLSGNPNDTILTEIIVSM